MDKVTKQLDRNLDLDLNRSLFITLLLEGKRESSCERRKKINPKLAICCSL